VEDDNQYRLRASGRCLFRVRSPCIKCLEESTLLMLAVSLCVRLTLGLMGLDELHLRVLSTSSDDETERRNAAQGARYARRRWVVGTL
jgi:hypothetical protein